MQGKELAQLAVNDPFHRAVRVLTLYPKNRLVSMERVQTVTHADAQAVEQRWHSSMSSFVALDPQTGHQRR